MRWLPLLLLTGCACETDPWDRYLWVEIVGLPPTTTRATLTYEADGERWPCELTFEPSGDDFAEVATSDCEGADDLGTYLNELWIKYPEPDDRRVVFALEYEADGAVGGFEPQEIQPDWQRAPLENGAFCPGERIGRVFLDPEGDTVRGP